jgi:hypothetical protein
MVESELIETKPCPCGAKLQHFRFADVGTEIWYCENTAIDGPDGKVINGPCGAFGLTYEQALKERRSHLAQEYEKALEARESGSLH